MSPKEFAKENMANTIIKNMKKKNMEGYYCATSAEAVEKALSLMPEGASLTWGGSVTLAECGLMDAIHEKIMYSSTVLLPKHRKKPVKSMAGRSWQIIFL